MATFPHENSPEKQKNTINEIEKNYKNKNYGDFKKPFSKDNFTYNSELGTYFCPLGEPLYKRREYEYKNKKRITYWTKECKNCPIQEYCAKKQRYRTIEDYGNPSKIRMQRKMETEEAQKIYKLRSKTAELPFANMKQNMTKSCLP